MSEPLRLLLAALATYRLAQLVAIDDGPGDVFLRLRVWAGSYEYGQDERPKSNLGRLLACPYCVGVWAALLCALAVALAHPLADAWLVVLGLAGAQAVLQGRRG